MGNHSNEDDCNLKHRNIPKLTATEGKPSDKDSSTEKKKPETQEERIARINAVNITLGDFVFKCLDHEMIKLFILCMLGFFFITGIVTCIYLTVIFFFKQSLWQFYFPTEAQIKVLRGEL
jgi:hypothetical protein